MFFKSHQLMFIFMLILGTIISISANSWFTAWLGLEINLMSMIPLMLNNLNPKLTESAIKYFLSQAMASILLIMSVALGFSMLENMNLEFLEIMVIVSLAMKTGLAPFHFWFPQVSNNINWTQCIMLFTWQKVAPLMLISSVSFNFLIPFITISAVTGCLGGFNQTLTKIMLTYSSISHSSWMIMACVTNLFFWLSYFSIYTLLSVSIITFFKNNSVKKINQIFSNSESPFNKFILSLNILSLGGIPPLLGFSAKMSIIIPSIKSTILLIFVPLIFSSLVSLFFYSRMIYSNLLNTSKKQSFVFLLNKKNISNFYILTLTLNISAPLIFNLS